LRQFRGDEGPAFRERKDRGDQSVRNVGFDDVALRPGLQRARGVDRLVMDAEYQDLAARIAQDQPADRFETADAGHRNIQHHHVRPLPVIQLTGAFAAVGFMDRADALAQGEIGFITGPDDRMIIDQ